MTIHKRLAEQAAANARLVNLDLDEDARRDAVREAAAYLRAVAAMEPLSQGAANIVRLVRGSEVIADDRGAYLRTAADLLWAGPGK